MRSFEFARKTGSEEKAFEDARLPEYSTKSSAGADFFCAVDTEIPSIWCSLFRSFFNRESDKGTKEHGVFHPTLVHTGIKASMEEDEVLELYNRSSNPKKLGLILANGVGVVDSDYYNNPDNDGEIMFAFFNLKPWTVTLKAGDKVGQGVFKKFLRPEKGLVVKGVKRCSGFGSTGK